ncbi:MAG: hypothetical protein V2I67_05870 [Thermoanaerobaculales bacterium]|jgi:hypothetical protein|nr:hypothetical protein [Thermoanaerobaculales bacterium]
MRKLWIVLLVVVAAGTASTTSASRALHYFENDKISIEVNDYEYPYDQIRYLHGTSNWINNLYHLKLAFWDGSQIWEYNTTTLPNGFTGLVEVQDWVVSGADPVQTAHVVLGDHATTPSFTIDLTIHMEGDGFKGVRSDYVITAVTGSLSGAKLYLYGDPRISNDDWTNRSTVTQGLFHVYDTANTPNLWWSVATNCGAGCSAIPVHYYGHHYSGSYGTEPLRGYMLTGSNLPDLANNDEGNQVAGWNWDLGSFSGSVSFTIYMGVGTSFADLQHEVQAPIFRDGFESGTTDWW